MERHSAIATAKSDTVWAEANEIPEFKPLASDARVDVCIVGGGIAGLTTAYLLAKEGQRIVLLDDGPLAQGMTYVTTAHLSNEIDDRMTNIEFWHGAEGARLAVESHGAAIDRIESISRELGIDCDFRRLDGYLFAATEDDRQALVDELAAAKRAGLAAEMVPRAPRWNISTPVRRFAFRTRAACIRSSILPGWPAPSRVWADVIHTNTHVDRIDGGKDAKVAVGGHVVNAGAVVVATNSPINDRVAIHTKQAPYMTYVIGARVPRGAVADALYWDTLDAYHYVRLQEYDAEHDILIVGGEDHKTGQMDDDQQPHLNLEAWARERFPIGQVEFTWGGQVMETIDGLAFIGRNPLDDDNVYIATGDSGMGITHGTLAGILLTDLIMWPRESVGLVVRSRAKTMRAAKDFAKENLNVAVQYSDWVTPGEVSDVSEILPGHGALIRRGMTKVAASRDEHGEVTELSRRVPAPGMHRPLEQCREHVGLPLPWVAVPVYGRVGQRSGQCSAQTGGRRIA